VAKSNHGVNKLAQIFQDRVQNMNDKPPLLDFGVIQEDMSLLTNKFPLPIPVTDYVICRSVCYDPEIPLSLTWWQDEGWNGQTEVSDWQSAGQKNQPQQWTSFGQPEKHLDHWGELMDSGSKKPIWDIKHRTPPIDGDSHIHNSKGEHDHEEDGNGIHYHDVYLPRKMYRIQPGDRVLVAWVGDDAVVIDIIMAATEMM